MARLHSFSALCPLALVLLLIPSAADAQQRTYRSAQQPPRHGQPTERADQPSEQPHQLELPSAARPAWVGRLWRCPSAACCCSGPCMSPPSTSIPTAAASRLASASRSGQRPSFTSLSLGRSSGGGWSSASDTDLRPSSTLERSLYGFQGMVSF